MHLGFTRRKQQRPGIAKIALGDIGCSETQHEKSLGFTAANCRQQVRSSSAKMTCASCASELLLHVLRAQLQHHTNGALWPTLAWVWVMLVFFYFATSWNLAFQVAKVSSTHWKLSFRSKLASVQWDQHKHALETL